VTVADRLLVATGREPVTGRPRLGEIGVRLDDRGHVVTDRHLPPPRRESTRRGVTGRMLFTDAAHATGRPAARNALRHRWSPYPLSARRHPAQAVGPRNLSAPTAPGSLLTLPAVPHARGARAYRSVVRRGPRGWGTGLCCFNRHGAELVAAPVPAAELVALAAWLPLA
jgi:hypothetical protein